VTFADKFPEQVEFEIDRPRLVRYLRACGFAVCVGGMIPVSLFFSLAAFSGSFQHRPPVEFDEILPRLATYLATGVSIGCCVGVLLYFITAHFPARWAAQNVRLIVEGPYLRLVSGAIFVSDRRMHFRTISDYSTHSGPLLWRFGMKTLSFSTTSGRNGLPTRIAGLVDPDKVRDALCEIDAAREN
jgi:membrane protein YdbS with pleckstrin-like domain